MEAVAGLVGKIDLAVPVFSSAMYQGRPLFAWAKERPYERIVAPVRRMAVHEIQVTDVGRMDAPTLHRAAHERIPLVTGDFRQDAVLARWDTQLATHAGDAWPAVRMRIACAGGTYIRSLANELGRRLGTGAFLTGLRRTRVADWAVGDPEVIRPS
jgi:tRNA pseudouridine(55) synthase